MYGSHPHTQSLAYALGDFRPCEWLVQRAERCVDRRVHNAVRYTLPARPSDFFFCTSCGTPNEDRQMFGRHEKQRAPHARCLDQNSVVEGFFNMCDL
jgi:hypothetical protein